jgi:hypothetical protein
MHENDRKWLWKIGVAGQTAPVCPDRIGACECCQNPRKRKMAEKTSRDILCVNLGHLHPTASSHMTFLGNPDTASPREPEGSEPEPQQPPAFRAV